MSDTKPASTIPAEYGPPLDPNRRFEFDPNAPSVFDIAEEAFGDVSEDDWEDMPPNTSEAIDAQSFTDAENAKP